MQLIRKKSRIKKKKRELTKNRKVGSHHIVHLFLGMRKRKRVNRKVLIKQIKFNNFRSKQKSG